MSAGELSPLPRHRDVFRLDHAAPTHRVRRTHRDATGLISPAACARTVAGWSRRRPRQPDRKRRSALLISPVPPPHPRAEDRVVLRRPGGAHDRPPSFLLPGGGLGATTERGRVGSPWPM